MWTTRLTIAAVMTVALSAASAQAQDAVPPQDGPPPQVLSPPPELSPPPQDAPAVQAPGRYSFSRVDGGFLRLDSVSGQVAICSQRAVGWACQAVPDDRAALDSEMSRLQGEVTQLKSELAALRASSEPPRPPAELAPRAEGDPKAGGLKLPTDADIKWARTAIERLWRQFVDMVTDLQKDVERKG